MHRANQDVLLKRLDVDVADGSELQPPVGAEVVHQPLALHSIAQLLLHGNEQFWIDNFQTSLRLITHAGGDLNLAPDRSVDDLIPEHLLRR